jgi:hypothetical protein
MSLFHICYLPPHASQYSLRCGCRLARLKGGTVQWLACAAHVGELAGANGIAVTPLELAELPREARPEDEQPDDWRMSGRGR